MYEHEGQTEGLTEYLRMDTEQEMRELDVASMVHDIINAVDDFAAVQKEHSQALMSGRLKDIMSWREKRARVFGRLKQYLDRVKPDEEIREDLKFADRFREKIRSLLDQEKLLEINVGRCREHLEKQIGAIRRGKKALNGYKVNNHQTARPRVLSNRI